MKQSFLDKLACPFDKHDLKITVYKKQEEEILEGILTCKHCQRYYPIIHGIPIMSPDEYREINLEKPLLEKWRNTIVIKEGKPTLRTELNEVISS